MGDWDKLGEISRALKQHENDNPRTASLYHNITYGLIELRHPQHNIRCRSPKEEKKRFARHKSDSLTLEGCNEAV